MNSGESGKKSINEMLYGSIKIYEDPSLTKKELWKFQQIMDIRDQLSKTDNITSVRHAMEVCLDLLENLYKHD